jgi:hypothetical protein
LLSWRRQMARRRRDSEPLNRGGGTSSRWAPRIGALAAVSPPQTQTHQTAMRNILVSSRRASGRRALWARMRAGSRHKRVRRGLVFSAHWLRSPRRRLRGLLHLPQPLHPSLAPAPVAHPTVFSRKPWSRCRYLRSRRRPSHGPPSPAMPKTFSLFTIFHSRFEPSIGSKKFFWSTDTFQE